MALTIPSPIMHTMPVGPQRLPVLPSPRVSTRPVPGRVVALHALQPTQAQNVAKWNSTIAANHASDVAKFTAASNAQHAADVAKFIAAAHPGAPKPAAAPKPGAPTSIPAGQNAAFNTERAVADNTYRHGLAMDTANQGTANQGFAQQLQALQQRAPIDRANQDFSMNDRGMMNSGIYNEGLSNLLRSQLQSQGAVNQRQAESMGNFHSALQGLLDNHAQQLANISSQRQAAISAISNGSIK